MCFYFCLLRLRLPLLWVSACCMRITNTPNTNKSFSWRARFIHQLIARTSLYSDSLLCQELAKIQSLWGRACGGHHGSGWNRGTIRKGTEMCANFDRKLIKIEISKELCSWFIRTDSKHVAVDSAFIMRKCYPFASAIAWIYRLSSYRAETFIFILFLSAN